MSLSKFNVCGDILNHNNFESSANYTNLPLIMSGLNMNSTGAPTPTTCVNTHQIADDLDSSEFSFPVAGPSSQPPTFPTNIRSLPSRLAKCKENSLSSNILKIKRRSIVKPKRLTNSISMDANKIKQLYTINEISSTFKSSSLETIFEEPSPGTNFLGKRKLRRSLSFSDGINVAKTRIKNRRQRVKRVLGKRFALKKISLDEFYDRLNNGTPRYEETGESVQSNKTVNPNSFKDSAMETYTDDDDAGDEDQDDADI